MHILFWYSTFSWSSREIENFNFRCLLLSQKDSVRSILWILSFQSDSVHSILWILSLQSDSVHSTFVGSGSGNAGVRNTFVHLASGCEVLQLGVQGIAGFKTGGRAGVHKPFSYLKPNRWY